MNILIYLNIILFCKNDCIIDFFYIKKGRKKIQCRESNESVKHCFEQLYLNELSDLSNYIFGQMKHLQVYDCICFVKITAGFHLGLICFELLHLNELFIYYILINFIEAILNFSYITITTVFTVHQAQQLK